MARNSVEIPRPYQSPQWGACRMAGLFGSVHDYPIGGISRCGRIAEAERGHLMDLTELDNE